MCCLLFWALSAAELGSLLEGKQQADATVPSSTPAQQQHEFPSAASDAAAEAAAGGEVFNWTQAWYPLAAVSALKKDAPTAQQLLGMRLVVWWDNTSQSWRCFKDLCPHR